MEPECSLPCSQQPVTCPRCEPDQYSPRIPISFRKRSTLILPCYVWLGLLRSLFHSGVFYQNPECIVLSLNATSRDIERYREICLLTAIGLTPGGGSTVHIYTQTIYTSRMTQLIWEECGPCPVFASYTLAFALQLKKKHGKSSVRVRKNLSQIREKPQSW
jgi:hypothetical protein